MKALEPDVVEQRIVALKFLVDANLISDPVVRDGLEDVIRKGPESIPQFLPVGAKNSSLSTFGVTKAESSKDSLMQRHPTLKGKNVALVGFRVRHGDIVDAITPIYSKVSDKLSLSEEYDGERVGGDGGSETILKQPGYVVTGFDVHRGNYFNRSEVVHFTVYWSKLTSAGIDINDTIPSKKLGGGNYAKLEENPKQFRSSESAFISDLAATTSFHTSGETFLNDIEISETVLVTN